MRHLFQMSYMFTKYALIGMFKASSSNYDILLSTIVSNNTFEVC